MKLCCILILLLGSLFYSCKKKNTEAPVKIEEKTPVPVGSVKGRILLQSETGIFATTHGGSKVTLEGTEPLQVVLTNELGDYAFADVKIGNYILRIEKEGFPIQRWVIEEVKAAKNNFISDIRLVKKASTKIESVTFKADNSVTPLMWDKIILRSSLPENSLREMIWAWSLDSTIQLSKVFWGIRMPENKLSYVFFGGTSDTLSLKMALSLVDAQWMHKKLYYKFYTVSPVDPMNSSMRSYFTTVSDSSKVYSMYFTK